MNCPSRTDNLDGREGWNQSPNDLAGTTREDFNGIANARTLRRIKPDDPIEAVPDDQEPTVKPRNRRKSSAATVRLARTLTSQSQNPHHVTLPVCDREQPQENPENARGYINHLKKARKVLATFGKFVGPGFMISVAYIDPGNYATDVAAGASYRYKLLFVVLMSNIIAIYLQSLCIKMGTVSGMDLAQMCRAHLPKWLNLFLYFMAEGAIIATDIAEVIGTAIAINLLIPKIPLVAGCAISIVDVLLILLFYRPNGSMKGLRLFEFFVVALVLGVVILFCIELSLIKDTPVGEVFRGYLPSSAIVESNGLFQACGILGATVMPHSLYLGSGIVQPRLLDYDLKNGHIAPLPPTPSPNQSSSYTVSPAKVPYQPSLSAINFCLKYSVTELALSLFTFALFVNSAILIVAGASLSDLPGSSDDATASLFSIHDLLSSSIAPAAGTIFAIALLLSGISAGIVCTIAGQMVSEGALNWSLAPWLRRLITRSISITPSIIIAGAVGREGLTAALNGTQVALSVALPFISAPIIYFTCRNKFMTVKTGVTRARMLEEELKTVDSGRGGVNGHESSARIQRSNSTGNGVGDAEENGRLPEQGVSMRNHWVTTAVAMVIWLVVAIMNVANLVLLGLRK